MNKYSSRIRIKFISDPSEMRIIYVEYNFEILFRLIGNGDDSFLLI